MDLCFRLSECVSENVCGSKVKRIIDTAKATGEHDFVFAEVKRKRAIHRKSECR